MVQAGFYHTVILDCESGLRYTILWRKLISRKIRYRVIRMNKKVLVVGGSYFIGRSIVDAFLKGGYEVYVLNRGHVSVWDKRIHQIICDRDNGSLLKEALYQKSFEIVVDVCGLDSKQAEKLCSALDREKIEAFLFISSSAVYNVKTLEIPYKENDSLAENPYWWNYGTDKIKAEFYYTGHFVWTDTKLIILRPPYVYGENNYVQRESFIFKHIEENRPVIIPSSNPKLQFIYVQDLADFALSAVENVTENINIFNVGNKECLTAREWVNSCAKAAGGKVDIIEYDYELTGRNVREFFPFYDYDNVLDVSKMKSVYKKETDFVEGLKKAYSWYKKNADTIAFKENVTFNEKQILEELEKARIKAEEDNIQRTADTDDAEAEAWLKEQISVQRSIDLGTDEDFDTSSIEVRIKGGLQNDGSSETENTSSVYITKDKSMMNVLDVSSLISQGAPSRTAMSSILARAMEHSVCYALFEHEELIGFARVVTDMATVGYLCDFVIAETHRGKGYGRLLMEYIKNDETLTGCRIIVQETGYKKYLKKSGFADRNGYMEITL